MSKRSDEQKGYLTEVVTLTMRRDRALELGLLTCACGHPENNHFDHGRCPCAHCPCGEFVEVGGAGVGVPR